MRRRRARGESAVNQTFVAYAGLHATHLRILRGDEVDQESFDGLVNQILTEDKDFVIDSGASGFLPMLSYLVQMGSIEMITAAGKQVVVHTVLNAGGALSDTLAGFDALARQLPREASIVVWLNEHVGPILSPSGKPFEGMPIYEEHKDRITAVVRIPAPRSPMFARAMGALIESKSAFEAVLQHADDPSKRQRLMLLAKPILEQVAQVI